MTDKQKTPVTIDGEDFVFEDMTATQQRFVEHIADLDRKIRTTQFNLDQLVVGRESFVTKLKEDLGVGT
jgi:hypothetical protein